MIDFEQAKEIVLNYLNKGKEENSLVLVEEDIVFKDYGWIFSYTSKEFLETGDYSYAIAGNIPFLVDLEGEIHKSGLGSSFDLQFHIQQFDHQFG